MILFFDCSPREGSFCLINRILCEHLEVLCLVTDKISALYDLKTLRFLVDCLRRA